TACVLAHFSRFSLQFYCSMRMGPRQEMVFHGTKGFVTVTAPFNARLYDGSVLRIRHADGTETTERFVAADHYMLQIEAFNESVLEGTPYPCTLEFSRGNQRMIDMIYGADIQK
ncbi:MAG: gfo/Idh/MocA family oxidoreductase, partial [Spirochaetaceae bacterium]